ncbi:hypothetical protein LINGRAHAP2_LOCUS25473 [Linum grandiflorum]
MASDTETHELYFVFMNYDPEYQRLRADRTKRGANELDVYLSKKHDELLSRTLEVGTYNKTCSLVIVDGFAVEITEDQACFQYPSKTNFVFLVLLFGFLLNLCLYKQANVLRSAEGVRLVEKNQELN